MKIKLFIAAVIFAFASCSSDKLDPAKAKETVEACLTAIDQGDYAKVKTDYYSSELSSAESAEELTGKFKKLKEVTGDMQSFELKETEQRAELGEESQVILTYNVKHARVATTEKFNVILESGKYKISSHDIKNE
jgi:hypothetical protein